MWAQRQLDRGDTTTADEHVDGSIDVPPLKPRNDAHVRLDRCNCNTQSSRSGTSNSKAKRQVGREIDLAWSERCDTMSPSAQQARSLAALVSQGALDPAISLLPVNPPSNNS